jgi:hypothetical protein
MEAILPERFPTLSVRTFASPAAPAAVNASEAQTVSAIILFSVD